jgi:hypothetical protein
MYFLGIPPRRNINGEHRQTEAANYENQQEPSARCISDSRHYGSAVKWEFACLTTIRKIVSSHRGTKASGGPTAYQQR